MYLIPTTEVMSPSEFEEMCGDRDPEFPVPVCEGEWRCEEDGWWRFWRYDEE